MIYEIANWECQVLLVRPSHAVVNTLPSSLLQMKTGVILNCMAQVVVTVCTITYGVPLFGLNAVPDWALNITSRH